MKTDDQYSVFMRAAIDLARLARFSVCPNPMVGAVLIRDGKIAAQGYHKKFGAPHAEIECLEDARQKGVPTQGATLCVTLEPCRHHGKTPPCVDAISASGISRLVFGCHDPNPEASGGAKLLAETGIEVIGPLLETECRDLIADFTIWQTTARPYVLLKLASTIDGRIATRARHSRWISSELSRAEAHSMRAGLGECGGAILIGGGTFRADNPALSARLDKNCPQPLAAILTSRLPRPDADFRLLRERPEQTIFFASPAATASTTAEELRKLGCQVIAIGPSIQGTPNFDKMFSLLRSEFGCPYVLCEGGGRLALSLLETGYVDEFHLFQAPMVLGDNEAAPLFDGRSPLSLDEAIGMRISSISRSGQDAHLVLRPRECSPA